MFFHFCACVLHLQTCATRPVPPANSNIPIFRCWKLTTVPHDRSESCSEAGVQRTLGTSFTLNCAVYAFMMDLINKLWAYKTDRCVYKATTTFYDFIKGSTFDGGSATHRTAKQPVAACMQTRAKNSHHKLHRTIGARVTNGDIFRPRILWRSRRQRDTPPSMCCQMLHANILRPTNDLNKYVLFGRRDRYNLESTNRSFVRGLRFMAEAFI